MREAPRGVTPEPSRVQNRRTRSSERVRAPLSGGAIGLVLRDWIGPVCRRVRSSERVRAPLSGGAIDLVLRDRVGSVSQGCSCPTDSSVGHHGSREKPRAGFWWRTSRELSRAARPAATRPFGKALECRAPPLPQRGRGKHRRERSGKPDPRRKGKGSGEERKNPREYRLGAASAVTGTDPRGEQDLEAAGHRDLLVLRAAERDVKNSMKVTGAERRTAPRGGKALQGEPHEWHRPSWSEGAGGRKPSRG